ncbi:IS607 family transposase [Streptomyces sp. 4503]|uniref:IS607 family transposase n=1 Tax=Streptomyces niphimycinicus TaxID=2842201 RepID=A0ABS6CL46_9ACTN|nr:IS607 family transposase [Streptomyces niphimycinicus]MBU3867405.1 IS607 family transposase [Streptomyces niphimycinicus]
MVSMYRISEFAERIGRSPSTVRRWEREGRIVVRRTASGQRYFNDADVRRVLQPGFDEAARKTVVYCRVSSPGQKDDLASQITAMEEFCRGRGLAVDEWVREIGGGMNLKRKKLLALMDSIERGEVGTLVIAHTDRLARFGFEYLEYVADKNDCTILVANQESLSPQEEMVQDLLAIVHTFSGRLDGLRKYEKTLKGELAGDGR